MTAYRIRNWKKHYENNRTRLLTTLNWIPIPVALDSDGFAEIMEHPNGAAHFGIFIMLLEIGARCSPRGDLMRNRGMPHDAASVARVCRIPALLCQEAIDRLVSIGWVETWHHDGTQVPEDGTTRAIDYRETNELTNELTHTGGKGRGLGEGNNGGGAGSPTLGATATGFQRIPTPPLRGKALEERKAQRKKELGLE